MCCPAHTPSNSSWTGAGWQTMTTPPTWYAVPSTHNSAAQSTGRFVMYAASRQAANALNVDRCRHVGPHQTGLTLTACWCAVLQDGNNINNIMTVLPRDAHDNNVRERLLAPKGELCARPSALHRTAQSTYSPWGPGVDCGPVQRQHAALFV